MARASMEIWGIAVLIAAVMPVTAAPPRQPDTAAAKRQAADESILDKARDAIVEQQPATALELIEPLLLRLEAEVAKESRRVYSGQSPEQMLMYLSLEATDKKDAIDVGPHLGEANFWKAFALTDVGRAPEAGPYFERAVALAPNNPHYLCELGHWYAVRKQTERALDLYERCLGNIAMGPKDAQEHLRAVALRGKGYVLIDMGKLHEAERADRESLKIEPDAKPALDDLKYIQQLRANPGRNST